jgi:hypothetical protein
MLAAVITCALLHSDRFQEFRQEGRHQNGVGGPSPKLKKASMICRGRLSIRPLPRLCHLPQNHHQAG